MVTEIFAQLRRRENCQGDNCLSTLPEVRANESSVENGLAIVFGVFAAVAIIVIILAAISFATSEGNPENIAKAKKTIVYALIGLVLALAAEAIVLLVLGRL
jgi:hypothetical protein